MENTHKILSNLLAFIKENRRSGTTTAIKEFLSRNDIFVVTHSAEAAKQIGPGAVSMYNLPSGSVPKPVLVDNGAMIKLLEEAILLIEQQEIEKKNLRQAMRSIADSAARIVRQTETALIGY